MFLWLRPRKTIRFAPALIPMLVLIQIFSPGSISGIVGGFFPKGGLIAQQSQVIYNHGGLQYGTRLSRVGPVIDSEFMTHNPLFGEGYSTRQTGRNVANPSQVLDDQWLGTLLETGIFGVLGWLSLFVLVIARLGRRAKEERDLPGGWLPVALAASIGGYAVSMGTYDAFGFVQATFLLYVFIAFAAVILWLPPLTTDDATSEALAASQPPARVLQHA